MSSSQPRAGRAAAERAEPRAVRTRTRILAAIRAAVAEKGIDGLTVSDICRRAEIHRVTFYGHWSAMSDALVDAFAERVDALAAVSDDAIAAARTPAQLADVYREALVAQLAELARERDVYRALLRGSGPHSFAGVLRDALQRRAQLAVDALRAAGVDVPGADGTAAAYLAAGVTGAFTRFADSEDDPRGAAAEIGAQLPLWWPRA